MRQVLVIITCLFFVSNLKSQDFFDPFEAIKNADTSKYRLYFLRTDDTNYELDSAQFVNLNPDWIDAITVIEETKDKEGNSLLKPGAKAVFIEMKKKYLKEYLKAEFEN